MYLEKIEIPSFRVLRDVVLEFGEVYDPQIFPLGSENGGGKSTALQLIFTLLHCSAEPARHPYLQNLLALDSSRPRGEQKLIARMTIRTEEGSSIVEFLSLADSFLSQNLKEDPPRLGFSTEAGMESANQRIARLNARLGELAELAAPGSRTIRVGDLLGPKSVTSPLPGTPALSIDAERKATLQAIGLINEELGRLTADWKRIQSLLVAHNQKYITTYARATPQGLETLAVVCRVAGQSASWTEELLAAIAPKVFLLGPSSQQYLFLPKKVRRALLRTKRARDAKTPVATTDRANPQMEYLQSLDAAEAVLPGFLAYDWLSMAPLVKLFLAARDEDFEQAVRTSSYGDRYTTLLKEVNGLLFGKRVRPLVGEPGRALDVEFHVTDANGVETTLGPEDLSQGELKRLMIYAWLRSNSIVDALVLIDEIETSFHPDWQVGIVRDLHDWGPKNQYILATHSYELCQAVTPGHIRELQPRLRRGGGAASAVKESGEPDA